MTATDYQPGTSPTIIPTDYRPGAPSTRELATKRVSTGSVAGSSEATVTVTWDTPFADENYTVVASVLDAADAGLTVERIRSQTAAAITVRLINDNLGARTGTLHAVAVRD